MKRISITIKKKISTALVLGILSVIIFTSCNKKETQNDITNNKSLGSEVVGTYTGTLKNSSTNESKTATLTVDRINDSLVSMHCIANGFDSTIVIQLYQNYDSIMVCYTGQEFYNQYGHNLNNYNFCNSKPNHWQSNWCNTNNCWGGEDNWNAWTNHQNTQHNQNDMHFGGFNPSMNSCNYRFLMNTGNTTYYEVFAGNKVN